MKFKLIILLFLAISNLFANNINFILPSQLVRGEPLTFSLEVTGVKIEMPTMKEFVDMNIQEISSSSSSITSNGKVSQSIKKIYAIFPKESFTFPSLEIKIDDKLFYTKEKKIEVIQPSKTQSDLFDLSLKASKNNLFLGENFLLTLVFKYKKDAKIIDLAFQKPNFDDFYFEQLKDNKEYEENGFVVQEINFLMTPLKTGKIKLDAVVVNAQIMDIEKGFLYSNNFKDIKIYSNDMEFNIFPLEKDIKLVGDFSIESFVDKQNVKRGEAISYKIKIAGFGNFDSIGDIKLDLKNATIYENKPLINKYLKGDTYYGEYIKTFSIVPNESLFIEPFTLKYYDNKEKKVVEKSSNRIKINVEIQKDISSVKLEKQLPKTEAEIKIIKEEISIFDRFLYFILGIISTIFIFGLYLYVKKQKLIKSSYEKPLIKKVLASKTKDELIKTLSIYIKLDEKLDKLIFKLEKENDIKSIKKELVEVLKELNL